MNVFIVEDQAWFLDQLSELVKSVPRAQVVGSSSTAADAITTIQATKPDVVLLDLLLKEGTGFDVMRRLRAQALDIPLLIVSSFPTAGIKKVCMIGGAHSFYDKLLELNELRNTLQTLTKNFD